MSTASFNYTAIVLVSVTCLFGTFPRKCISAELSLRQSGVVMEVREVSYVHYTVNELRQQVTAITGLAPVLYHDLKEARQAPGVLVVVGRGMADQLTQEEGGAVPQITDHEPGRQGFILRSLQLSGNKEVIVAAGSESAGTNYAVMQLRQFLMESPSGLGVPKALNLTEKPKYQARGLYLFQHWRYNYPYGTWTWSVEDWKRALDMAAYLRINLVLMWPHMDMLAPPLSIPEQDYLADIREVVDYARRKRGIKIWMVEPANVLLDTEDVKRLPWERRDYYALARIGGGGLKNPADAKQFEALMANRELLYRAVPNADGYSYIDSDPGGWLGSPSSEFVDIFVGNRKLLDQYHERPREVALVYWVFAGWGKGTPEDNWRDATQGFERRVSEPREFLVCWTPHLKLAKELQTLDRSVFFPYGVIEGEPTFPLTNINFESIGRAFEFASKYPGLKGVMANSQTFLMQIPNIYYFARLGWNDGTEGANDLTLLRSLGRLLFPEKADLLAEAWSQLKAPGSEAALEAAGRIGSVLNSGRTGRPGTVGSYVFPSSIQVLQDLVTMLRIHASAERVREQVAATRAEADVVAALEGYLREMLDWQRKNGFWGAYGMNKQPVADRFMHGPDYLTVKSAWERYAPDAAGRDRLQAAVLKRLLAQGYTEWIAKAFSGQLFGTYARLKPGERDLRIETKTFEKLPPWKELTPWLQP